MLPRFGGDKVGRTGIARMHEGNPSGNVGAGLLADAEARESRRSLVNQALADALR
jgi:hypothetical protein